MPTKKLTDVPAPLAARMRPHSLEHFVGQAHLLGKNSALRLCIESGQIHSMILWGPPGSGKTTLASIISHYSKAQFIALSAVMAGVKDIRLAIDKAHEAKATHHQATILFIDEIHRFNKAQQDALLPYVEDGTVFLIGATTENPSFEIIHSLLSRCRIYVLKPLNQNNLKTILMHALTQEGLEGPIVNAFTHEIIEHIIAVADGDARRLLNIVDILIQRMSAKPDKKLSPKLIEQIIQQDYRRFDKKGDLFYEQISALHKSVRGSAPDAAIYWLCRMLDGGCDPIYIARRVVRMASEDIGNADPRGLTLALDAWDMLERLGYPEGYLGLAQAVAYLASAPKSIAVYEAFNAAMDDVKAQPSYDVPVHLRNAPTGLMKNLGYGKAYRYDPHEPGGFAEGQTYFPDELGEKKYYYPKEQGLEIKIKEKLDKLGR